MTYLSKTLVALDINRMSILPKERQSCKDMSFSFPLNVTVSENRIIAVCVPPTTHKKRKKDKAWTKTE
jgi:hypothetical protein